MGAKIQKGEKKSRLAPPIRICRTPSHMLFYKSVEHSYTLFYMSLSHTVTWCSIKVPPPAAANVLGLLLFDPPRAAARVLGLSLLTIRLLLLTYWVCYFLTHCLLLLEQGCHRLLLLDWAVTFGILNIMFGRWSDMSLSLMSFRRLCLFAGLYMRFKVYSNSKHWLTISFRIATLSIDLRYAFV